ncbi:G-protein coupled receptor GRL101-like [Saccostrea echinata]|uniref:G-protein coupled receptor GRL101-like n=1 Tax=Saccostrea echinata TaxID=191078 RepID=UPI002A7F9869|nr:G-protein coupled receptor GRL101-like [Saccostrea echinata]
MEKMIRRPTINPLIIIGVVLVSCYSAEEDLDDHSALGAKIPDSVLERIRKLDENNVLVAARNYHDNEIVMQITDVVSPEITMSMSYRCLHYNYLAFEDNTLVVGYIKNYFKPYDLSEHLNFHESLVIKVTSASVTLPVGTKFKVVFRGMFPKSTYGFLLIDNITITDGICEKCGPNEFKCSNISDECIPFDKVCDLEPDCIGGEDEKRCNWSVIKSSCMKNESSMFPNETLPLLENGLQRKDKDSWRQFIPLLNQCEREDQCLSNSSDTCFLYCPSDCTCNDLSVNCSSDNVPSYATSITWHGLVQENLEISKERLPNVMALNILNCTFRSLKIGKYLNIESISIKYSKIDYLSMSYFSTDMLQYVHIFESSFQRLTFHRTKGYDIDEWYVYKSSLVDKNTNLEGLYGINFRLSESESFYGFVQELRYLVANFSFCNLTELQPSSVYDAITLDLSYNFLMTWKLISYTQMLHLQHNLITSLNYTLDKTQSEARLQYLDLSYNKIFSINNEDLEELPNLLYLILHENRLTHIQEKAFDKLTKLIHLDLSNNNLRNLNRGHFLYLSRLQYLNIQNNDVKVIEGMFDSLMNILYLQVDSYTLCCAQPKAVSKIQCLAPVNEISSCYNLIDLHILRIIIWYIALLALFGNMSGIFYRLYHVKKKSVTTFDIYSLNLGLADFFMGVYLYIIAGANIAFSGRYGFEDFSWRHSPYCIFAGVLATLSSEASALFVLLITIDRILVVRFPFSMLKKRVWISKLNSSLVWTFALFLSIIPLSGSEYFDDYYSSSGVCIYLPLSVLRKPGWEYSMIIFVGANFVIFIAILFGQFVIFTDVVRMGKKTALHSCSQQRRREIGLAKTLITVAITDMFCWIPIGSIGLLTFMGIDVTVQVYAWIIVAVLPINSALNPLIYTFSAIMRHGSHRPSLTDEEDLSIPSAETGSQENKEQIKPSVNTISNGQL